MRKVDKKKTKQIRIDVDIHKIAKVEAARTGRTLREVVEEGLSYVISIPTKNEEKNSS